MLLDYAENTYSQFGEDGILKYLFQVIGDGTKSCVEVGAGDGILNSNTRLLYENGWKSFQIEHDGGLYEALVRNTEKYPNVHTIYASVSPSNFDDMLVDNGFADCDLLVIDIDGDDYYIWDCVTSCKPRVVMIEYNPTFPFNIEYVQNQGHRVGSSSYALWKLGKSKGYHLVGMTKTNCIFVEHNTFMRHRVELKFPYAVIQLLASQENYYPRDYDMHMYSSGPWNFSGKVLESGYALDSVSSVHASHYSYEELLEMLQEE